MPGAPRQRWYCSVFFRWKTRLGGGAMAQAALAAGLRPAGRSFSPIPSSSSTNRSMIAGRSLARPAATMNDASAALVCSALPPRMSSTTATRRSVGSDGSVRALRSSSDPSKVRAKRNISSWMSPR